MKWAGCLWRAAVILLLACLLGADKVAPLSTDARASSSSFTLEWVRAAAMNPAVVWIGGAGWVMRSTSGGHSWKAVTALNTRPGDTNSYDWDIPLVDGSGRQIAIGGSSSGVTASSSVSFIRSSANGGSTWKDIAGVAADLSGDGGYGAGARYPVFSPVPPYRLWMQDVESDGDDGVPATVVKGKITDGGGSVAGEIGSLVPDPASADGLFVNDYNNAVEFSSDLGKSWRTVRAPHGVSSFSVAGDPLAPGVLVATSSDKKFPPDRRWYSQDGGRHWMPGVCGGDYRGGCPMAVLPAGTPGGVSVAITRQGLFTFTGTAGARGRATFTLPVKASAVLDVQGDLKPGDAVYLLAKGGRHGAILYRRERGGASWTVVSYPTPHPAS